MAKLSGGPGQVADALVVEKAVVAAARRLSRHLAKFDGDIQYAGGYLDALWIAIAALEGYERDPT